MTRMRSCSRAGSNRLCGKHGSPDRKAGEVHYPEGVFTTEIRQNDEGGFLLYVAYVPADGEPEENPRNEAVVKAICMHVCICMHLGMHTKKARKKPENPYI